MIRKYLEQITGEDYFIILLPYVLAFWTYFLSKTVFFVISLSTLIITYVFIRAIKDRYESSVYNQKHTLRRMIDIIMEEKCRH